MQCRKLYSKDGMEMNSEGSEICGSHITEKICCNRKSKNSGPIFFLDLKCYCCSGNRKNGNYKPIFIILESSETNRKNQRLNQIDKRLTYKEKHKSFQRCFLACFAIHNNKHRKQNPRFEVNRNVMERCFGKKRNNDHSCSKRRRYNR